MRKRGDGGCGKGMSYFLNPFITGLLIIIIIFHSPIKQATTENILQCKLTFYKTSCVFFLPLTLMKSWGHGGAQGQKVPPDRFSRLVDKNLDVEGV